MTERLNWLRGAKSPVMSDSLRPHGLQPARLLCPWGFSRQRILEWVAMPSSRGSSQPRAQTCDSYVSCIDRRVFFLSFFFFLPLALSGKPGSLSVILYLCDQYQYISALNSFVCTCFLPTLAIWDDWLGLIKGRLPSDSLQDYWLLPWPQYPRKKWMR